MNPQMKKGILEMCILFLISKDDMYGYDILKKMSSYFPQISESTFYAILRRIHASEYTEVYYQEPTLGPRRKYYQITDKGKRELEQHISDWKKINEIAIDIGIDFK